MTFINQLFLTLHNLTRWVFLVVAIILLIQAFQGWFGKKTYSEQNRKLNIAFTSLFDLQILFGVILFFSKGWGTVMMSGGDIMATAAIRFFVVEHWMIMLLGVILAHIGSSQVKKATTDLTKFRRTAIWFGISVVLVLAAIPWPGMAAGRPLLRLFGITL